MIEKPFGHDLASARELNRVVSSVFPSSVGVPDRPLPGQGDGAEHDGAAVRQPAVRAGLEQQLRRPRADHHGRGHRHRWSGGLLRRHRHRPRRHPEPPAAAAGPDRDGGADLVRGQPAAGREAEGAGRGPTTQADGPAHRPRPLRRRLAGRREGAWAIWKRRASRPTPRPRPTPRSGSTSTTAAGPASRSTCGPASGWPGGSTEIALGFKRAPHLPFTATDTEELGYNALVLRIQPDEGVTLRFGAKVPGTQMEIREVNMDFAYGGSFTESSPGGVRAADPGRPAGRPAAVPPARGGRAVLADPRPDPRLLGEHRRAAAADYESGGWGPASADEMLARDGFVWRRP